MTAMVAPRLRWGHININVGNLDQAIRFYVKLGFEVFIPGIPYLGLSMEEEAEIPQDACDVLGIPNGTRGRACIMQLGNSFPKIDLTELAIEASAGAPSNQAKGLVRFCLGSENLHEDFERLSKVGVEFLSPPQPANHGMADVAICVDPDGTLIELIQPHLEKWSLG